MRRLCLQNKPSLSKKFKDFLELISRLLGKQIRNDVSNNFTGLTHYKHLKYECKYNKKALHNNQTLTTSFL